MPSRPLAKILSRNSESAGIESMLAGCRLALDEAADGVRHRWREKDAVAVLTAGDIEVLHRRGPEHGRIVGRARPQACPHLCQAPLGQGGNEAGRRPKQIGARLAGYGGVETAVLDGR